VLSVYVLPAEVVRRGKTCARVRATAAVCLSSPTPPISTHTHTHAHTSSSVPRWFAAVGQKPEKVVLPKPKKKPTA
jgi:hypothetical protein